MWSPNPSGTKSKNHLIDISSTKSISDIDNNSIYHYLIPKLKTTHIIKKKKINSLNLKPPKLLLYNLAVVFIVASNLVILILDEPLPVPMALPNLTHFFNRNPLRLRQEKVDKDRHDQHEEGEEYEEPELHVAEHRQEELRYDEREEHVDRHVDALRRRPDLQREYLARHQPPQRAPRPREPRHVRAYEHHHHYGVPLGQLPRVPVDPELRPNRRRNNSLSNQNSQKKI